MTAKKKTSTKGKLGTRTIEARATRLINDPATNIDTRDALAYALAHDGPDDLAETVRRAERGETVVDTRCAAERVAAAARGLDAAFTSYGLPDFIADPILAAIHAACDRFELPLPKWMTEPEGDPGGASLAELLSAVPRSYTGKPLLAELLSAVMRHADTPEVIAEGIRGALVGIPEDTSDPRYLALILEAAARAEKGGE